MVQASTTYGGNLFKAAYYPYATGLLVAAAWEDERVKNAYNFKRFIFTRENTSDAARSLQSPAVIGFSNYVWNTEYNKALAKKVKALYPDCVTIFGGHNVPPSEEFLEKFDYIDFLIHGEGEEAFKNILIELCESQPDFSNVKNISYRSNGEVFTTPTEILTRLDYPSPYLTGVFDDIIRENPDMQLDAIIETSRGCPRSCAYCDWGCNSSKVKLYPLERVYAEIDWFAEHKTAFIWGADANFGAFKRDIDIADRLLKRREETGYPEKFRVNYAKDNENAVFEISCKFEKYGLSKEGATLSFQSLNPDVLEIIGRKNMTLEHFGELIASYKRQNVTTYSELILGLPGETYESFCRGIGMLLEAGQHRQLFAYICVLLPNSPMADKDYMKKYGIRTAEVYYQTAHDKGSNEIAERTKYIVGTDTMNGEDWIKANIFYCFVKSAHHYGMLKYFAIYLYFEKNIPYEVFFDGLVNYAKTGGGILGKTYAFTHKYYEDFANERPVQLYKNEIFGDITWDVDHMLHSEGICKINEFYDEVIDYLRSYNIEPEVLQELIRFHKCVLKQPGKNNFSEEFDYDWYDYFTGIYAENTARLHHKKTRVSINNETTPADWHEFAVEAVWFGRNGGTFNSGISSKDI